MQIKNRNQKGFTLIELVVVLAIMAVIAALTAPNIMEEINLRRATLTAHDTEAIADAARVYRVANSAWPGGADCSNAIRQLTTDGYLSGVTSTNRYNNAVTTVCTARVFQINQSAVVDWDGYLANTIGGTTITTPASNTITTSIGIPGTEAAMSTKLSRINTGNPEDSRMRTTLYMGNQVLAETGGIQMSGVAPVVHATQGNLTLNSAGGKVVVRPGQVLEVDDVIVRSRGNRTLSSSMPNYVHIGTYIVRDSWLLTKPTCANGGTPKAALRPAAMRGGYVTGYDPAWVGRFGFSYRLDNAGTHWIVTARAEGYDVDWSNLDSLADVYCYYAS